jgi:hypothetical protein
MHYSESEVAKHPFYSIWTKTMFGSVSEHFANLRHVKRCKTCVCARMHCFDVPKLRSIHSTPLEPRWWLGVFQSISLTSARKKMQNLCSCPNALFRGTKLAKGPVYSIRTKMMVGNVSEHFANLRHVKICKTCVSGLNALFWGTKVVNHPFYSIGTKMMFGSVSDHFANLRHVKRCKTCVRTRMHYFRVPKLWRIHSSLLKPKWYLGVFQSIFLTFDT